MTNKLVLTLGTTYKLTKSAMETRQVSRLTIYKHMHTSCLKLNRGGSCRPFGKRALGCRSSSKKGCAMASSCIVGKKF